MFQERTRPKCQKVAEPEEIWYALARLSCLIPTDWPPGLDDTLRIGKEEKSAIYTTVDRQGVIDFRLPRHTGPRHIPDKLFRTAVGFFVKLGRPELMEQICFLFSNPAVNYVVLSLIHPRRDRISTSHAAPGVKEHPARHQR